MDPDSCSDVMFSVVAVFVCSVALENDNIKLISRLYYTILGIKMAIFH